MARSRIYNQLSHPREFTVLYGLFDLRVLEARGSILLISGMVDDIYSETWWVDFSKFISYGKNIGHPKKKLSPHLASERALDVQYLEDEVNKCI